MKRLGERQAEFPSVKVAGYDGGLHELGGKAKEVWLGHLNTCTGTRSRTWTDAYSSFDGAFHSYYE